MPVITKLLVANRGEIACRVLTTARAKGYRTVAVFSDADADARHVRLADEAVRIGPAPVAQSYLVVDRIIAAAQASGADAIHPGYGFLSERAAFAEACQAAGITFVGPDPDAIRAMGDKAESKRRMITAGVPCVPGYQGDDQDEAVLIAEAERIGFPLMVKASAGGGGRGMRLVHEASSLPAALRTARSEAETAFGDGRLLLERAIIQPRHVEIQVFGDRHGNVIHLGERDCSVQRRHQKVVEEAPSPAVDSDLRSRMGAAAVQAAKAINYVGAGTVEFLLAADGSFYFLEMNTRLQVEHPVTELVTGLDLVALQLRVAEGHPLPLTQADVTIDGHAIEVRLYAEDPANDFLPQTGTVLRWTPAEGEGVRIDHGLQSGAVVSPYYDPMLAKLIAWGADRDEARRRLIRAVEETEVFGLATNRAFLTATLQNAAFARGEATTAFIGDTFPDGFVHPSPPGWMEPLAVVLLASAGGAPWRSEAWNSHPLKLGGPSGERGCVMSREAGAYRVHSGDASQLITLIERTDTHARFAVDGLVRLAAFHRPTETSVLIDFGGATYSYRDLTLEPVAVEESGSGGTVRAPMNGMVAAVEITQGATVVRGQLLLVLEAMKMEHQIIAPIDGVVEILAAAKGMQVASQDILVSILAEASE